MTTLQKLTKAEDTVKKLAKALSAESERLTVALDALHKLLALKPEYENPSQFYFAVRDIAREGIIGKQ